MSRNLSSLYFSQGQHGRTGSTLWFPHRVVQTGAVARGILQSFSYTSFTPLALILNESLQTHSLPLLGESSPCVPPHRRCELPCVRLRNTVRIFKENPQTVLPNPYCSVLGGTSLLFLLSVHMSSSFIFSPCSIRPHLSTESPGWSLNASNLEMGNVHFFSSFVFSSWLKMTKWD